MFPFFKKESSPQPADVKTIRDALLTFIKEQLSKAEGGEGGNIKGLQLFIACPEEDKYLYESAVYLEEEDKFKEEEVQKIADDYAINLPHDWTMEILFTPHIPEQAAKAPHIFSGLFIKTTKQSLRKEATATITVLTGTAEKEAYDLSSNGSKVYIGRDKKVQTRDGFYRVNSIAFPADSGDEANKFISRQHAHIEWDGDNGHFLLFADEGGLPPRNKVKVRSAAGDVVKLQTDRVGHQLQEGDQIMLGDGALLAFSYQKEI